MAKPLMGTCGLYLEDRIFGLVVDGIAYFRTTEESVVRYITAKSSPYMYERSNGTTTRTNYFAVPEQVLADQDRACAWAYEAAGGRRA